MPNQTYQTKLNVAYQAYWTRATKPKLLVKAVNTWVRSAFGNVLVIPLLREEIMGGGKITFQQKELLQVKEKKFLRWAMAYLIALNGNRLGNT